MYNTKTHPDFRKYYDTKLKRNYWVLGYFGGGAVTITEAMELAKQYAEATGVELDTVKIDEIMKSRRYAGSKYIFSESEQKQEQDIPKLNVLDNVWGWLTD